MVNERRNERAKWWMKREKKKRARLGRVFMPYRTAKMTTLSGYDVPCGILDTSTNFQHIHNCLIADSGPRVPRDCSEWPPWAPEVNFVGN